MLTRRDLIRHAGLGLMASGLPSLGFAGAGRDARLVLVILRGAVDGLAVAPPYGDGSYRGVRGELAMAAPGQGNGVLELDGLFGLHPALENVHAMYGDGEATVVHAVASPYRARSHFDGQDVLESGSDGAGDHRDGWLNRALGALGGGAETGIAMAQTAPLVLRGSNPVTSWAPSSLPGAREATLERVAMLYEEDDFFATRFRRAMASRAIAGDTAAMPGVWRGNEMAQWTSLAESAARFLVAADGPRIAVLEAGGWDTHANQGAATGPLANRLAGLDRALNALRTGLGSAWRDTAVCVVTEFGRTASINGTRGTDHGTGGAALLLGGAIAGGRVIADWPGLRRGDLYQGRDLRPTTDLRSLFKGILVEHLGLDESFVGATVFPGSVDAPAMGGLVRT